MTNPHEDGTLNHLLWHSLWSYPMMYGHAGDVLEFIYIVIGTGFDWEDGRLVCAYGDEGGTITEPPTDDGILKLNDPPLQPLRVQFEIDRLRRNAKALFVRENVSLLVFDIEREWDSLYPLSQYSKLVDVPDDARPDFLVGARLAIELAYGVLAKGGSIQFFADTGKPRRRDDRTRACIEILDESLCSINTRFGPDPRGVEANGYRLWGNFSEYVATKRKLNKEVRTMLRELAPAKQEKDCD